MTFVYENFLRPLLFRLDAERAHRLATTASKFAEKTGLIRPLDRFYRLEDSRLETEALGIKFSNPVGLAAGFDKYAEWTRVAYHFGFGFIEEGSFTAEEWNGNTNPRLFRLPDDRALINSTGLNNCGSEKAAGRLNCRRNIPVGINIAKTPKKGTDGHKAIADYIKSYGRLHKVADYLVLNLSCPNTPDGRTFEDPKGLRHLLMAVDYERRRFGSKAHILAKFSPDLSDDQFQTNIDVCEQEGVDGYVITNTTRSRSGLKTPPESVESCGAGGLSGPPLAKRATDVTRLAYKLTRKPIIGVGGVRPETAYERIKAGASLLQVYTEFPYNDSVARDCCENILKGLEQDGLKSISQAVGVEAGSKVCV